MMYQFNKSIFEIYTNEKTELALYVYAQSTQR